MTTDISTAKVITQHGPRDFDASFDGNYIGSFRSHPEAQQALNDHVMDLIEHGLIDTPLDAQPCIHCGTVQERASCDDCVAWPEQTIDDAYSPIARWRAQGEAEQKRIDAQVVCHLPRCITCGDDGDCPDCEPTYHAPGHCRNCGEAHHVQQCPEIAAALADPETPDPSPPPWDAPAIVRKTIVAWQCNRAACAQWLALFNDAEQRMLAQAVIAYRRQFFATDLTVERLVSEWKGGAR